MYHELDLADHGQALGDSLLAERVLFALAQYTRMGRVSEESTETLRDAALFLDRVNGSTADISPEASPDRFIEATKIVEPALEAAKELRPIRDDGYSGLREFVSHLRSVTEAVLAQTANADQIKTLREFFTRYSSRQYERSQILGAASPDWES